MYKLVMKPDKILNGQTWNNWYLGQQDMNTDITLWIEI